MAIDDKLLRIYEEAHSTKHKIKADLARAVAAKKLNEFSYERKGERQYHTWGTVLEYVSLLGEYGMITSDLVPSIKTERVNRQGFFLTLGENVEQYAAGHGFSVEKIRLAVKELIERKPAQLPTPTSIYSVLQLPVSYGLFQRALSVRSFQTRVNIFPKQKSVLLIPDILRE